jgi:DNA polymerase elongation subunit (family B)
MDRIDKHPKSTDLRLRNKPYKKKDLILDNFGPNRWIRNNRTRIIDQLKQDIKLIRELEIDMNFFVEFDNVSRTAYTDLTTTTNSGEQIRVYNKWAYGWEQEGMVCNSDNFAKGPLHFSAFSHPPTYPDIDEHPLNTEHRDNCYKDFIRKGGKARKRDRPESNLSFGKRAKVNQVEEVVEKAEAEGGNVIEPAPFYYGEDDDWIEDERLKPNFSVPQAILDFASLYPSIMMQFCLSYELVVFDEKYMNLPGYNYAYFKINSSTTIAVVQKQGFIPTVLKDLLANRKRLKKLMKKAAAEGAFYAKRYEETGDQADLEKSEAAFFAASCLDGAQLSMKILCNATYGFVGVDGSMGLLPLKELMYVVTCLGRNLQMFSSKYFADNYGIPTYYGDTDSIFTITPLHTPEQEFGAMYSHDDWPVDKWMAFVTEHAATRYKMNDYWNSKHGTNFTYDALVDYFAKVRKMDITKWSQYRQVVALLCVINDKLGEEINEVYIKVYGGRKYIVLELENISTMTWMRDKKKKYFLQFWDIWKIKIKYVKVKGMDFNKRVLCPWVRSVLHTMKHMLSRSVRPDGHGLYTPKDIKGYIEAEIGKLVDGKLKLDDLMTSYNYKREEDYKDSNMIHYQVKQQLETRHRCLWPENSRIDVIKILRPGKKFFECGQHPSDYRAQRRMYKKGDPRRPTVDRMYYLKKQLLANVKKMMFHHQHLFRWDSWASGQEARLFAAMNGMRKGFPGMSAAA